MTSDARIPPYVREAQGKAADPRASAWVSANAGSGKTFVLSRRVVRLLLDGVEPARILSLTFTKAAAANMATRVFEILAKWVSLDDAALSREIEEIEGRPPGADRLADARRLFARAVETPGGLKIQTIHAFCERLLHLFPFEANVSASFEVLDDLAAAELLAEARRELMVHAALHPDGAEARALSVVEEEAGETGFSDLLTRALGLKDYLREEARGAAGLRRHRQRLAAALGIDPDDTIEAALAAIVSDGIPPGEWAAIADVLEAHGKPTEQGHARTLREALAAPDDGERAGRYACVFLTKEEQPRSDRFLTSAFRAAAPALAGRLEGERERVYRAVERRRAVAALERSLALVTLAEAIIARYERKKGTRGALDFDDLVARTAQLLTRTDAAWVLYKLDQGIDHILVDEAQDTSAAQWEILKRMTAEFTAGRRNGRVRTVFAVGDPKQSIFSFQGADPKAFEEARHHFTTLYRHLAERDPDGAWIFNDEKLTLSFRSVPDVLTAVDKVFALESHFRGLGFGGDAVGTTHESARAGMPGVVEVWDPVTPAPVPDPDAWARPLDEPDDASPPVKLARRIADLVHRWNTVGDAAGRRIPPGDILILVRSRNAFFEAVIRALKLRRVPVAGADRLALTGHIAVMDLMALGRASLLPPDDLTLATVLKSPLFGITEDQLMELAANRGGRSLAGAIVARAAEDLTWKAVQDRLERWRGRARSVGPFTFYAGILGPDGGRRAILARLGSEAGDAVDEFLRLALDHEQREVPSLSAFLSGIEGADLVVKRDMEAGRDEVRVMTVHGAKGLEAPVVFLADTCSVPRNDAVLLTLRDGRAGGGLPVWSRGKAQDPERIRNARDGAEERMREEYHRLLYVGLTRARDRLIVAGFETARGRGTDCWYDMVERGLGPSLVEAPDETGAGRVRRLQTIPWPVASPAEPVETSAAAALPSWLTTPAPRESEPAAPLRPSGALAAADAVDRSGDTPFVRDARLAGTLAHALLEILPECPPERRLVVAQALASARAAGLTPERRGQVVAQTMRLLDDPALAALFGPGSRAEAPLAGQLDRGEGRPPQAVSGQIDRLAVTSDSVLIADYKTTARPPADAAGIPDSYVGQLAVYRALVSRLFPGKAVRCLLVWTAGPVAMEVPEARLDAALARIKAA